MTAPWQPRRGGVKAPAQPDEWGGPTDHGTSAGGTPSGRAAGGHVSGSASGSASGHISRASEPFTVVITRPAGQSQTLAAQLQARGLRTFEFPLITIEPVRDDAPLREALGALDRYALVVFVSPNAVDRAFACYGSISSIWPHALPVAVVGPASVAALARHGVAAPAHRVISPTGTADEEPARFDSESLYAALEKTFGANAFMGKRVLIVRGDGGREWLADRLREAGAEVEAVAAYRRVVPEPPIGVWETVHALLEGAPHAWLVTSSEGVRNLDELAREHLTAGEIVELRHAPLVAPHGRIGETARGLGFDRITVSGAGDERIVETLLGLAASLAASSVSSVAHSAAPPRGAQAAQPVQNTPASPPAQSRMTDSNDSSHVPNRGAASTASQGSSGSQGTQPAAASARPASAASAYSSAPSTSYTQPANARRGGAGTAILWLVVVLVAAGAGAGGYAINRKLDRMDAALVQRQQAAEQQSAALRARADQAVASAQQVDKQMALLEGKIADAQTSQQALAQQYADLAKNRDDWTLAEVGQMLASASEQLQLTGNTQLALFALQSADTRLAASDSPQALAVRKAIAQDVDKLKAAPSTDLPGLAIKLDTALAAVDTLPLAGEAIVAHTKPEAAEPVDVAKTAAATGEPRWRAWLDTFVSGVGKQIASLVQVRRIDNADAMLTSPDQGYFVRENLKLRLLSARLSLLSRNEPTLKSDLAAADTALSRYFDGASKETQNVRDLLKQVGAGSGAVTLPTLDTSLKALQQYRSRG
ncbi:fused uroporphyrinogen-III synthase HemD/membrane protein HemX [Paraburkholderia tagetis]|uniref:Fused uroporphyrinogen-III synthase HemD/membrane protein HemX n=1 Tax=Paraburkholderia tagetis TaxID=2913261 RepID=A0A9X1UKQ5_9BURK|nr:fused uroporphyrinogen-III synthase HemD/membrane protein HemX [Paraburkholderia tagetis]MCG5075356.1 fused uroporphyrinogen-III synthase HemD/membrane protein HemX [Paraburkholderia tagetis]